MAGWLAGRFGWMGRLGHIAKRGQYRSVLFIFQAHLTRSCFVSVSVPRRAATRHSLVRSVGRREVNLEPAIHRLSVRPSIGRTEWREWRDWWLSYVFAAIRFPVPLATLKA